jgi:hypothetical protein
MKKTLFDYEQTNPEPKVPGAKVGTRDSHVCRSLECEGFSKQTVCCLGGNHGRNRSERNRNRKKSCDRNRSSCLVLRIQSAGTVKWTGSTNNLIMCT